MILTRPVKGSPPEEVRAFFAALAQALTDEGVEHGQEFSVKAVQPIGQNSVIAGRADTSRRAAQTAFPTSGKDAWKIVHALVRAGERGYTREGLEEPTGLPGNTVRARIVDLMAGGWVVSARRTRPTERGNQAEVLIASERAVRACRDELSRSLTPGSPPTRQEPQGAPTSLFGEGPSSPTPNAIYQGD